MRETARSVEFEGVLIEGVSRAREGKSDADEPEVRERNIEKPEDARFPTANCRVST